MPLGLVPLFDLQLRHVDIAHYDKQQVIEVMSDPARQDPYRLKLLGVQQFLFKPLPRLTLHFVPVREVILFHFNALPSNRLRALNPGALLTSCQRSPLSFRSSTRPGRGSHPADPGSLPQSAIRERAGYWMLARVPSRPEKRS